MKNQFYGAECIIDYCNATLKRFFHQPDFFCKYKKRFVVFYKLSVSKKETRYLDTSKKNDTPERMLKYFSPKNPSLFKLIVQ